MKMTPSQQFSYLVFYAPPWELVRYVIEPNWCTAPCISLMLEDDADMLITGALPSELE